MLAPIPILCRGHSGGRLVCEAFIHNGIHMGKVSKERKDTEFFSIRRNQDVQEIILHAYQYQNGDGLLRARMQELMKQLVNHFLATEVRRSGPLGWKIDPMVFTMPVVLDAFPLAKVVHVIRDGRDVMLSRLGARFNPKHFAQPVNRLMIFGDETVDSFYGEPLTPETVEKYRNELEMKHWVTSVEYGLRGRTYGDRYLEVKYEHICADPLNTFEKIFAFIGVPFQLKTREWLKTAVTESRIAKWKTLSQEALVRPMQIGGKLLEALRYVECERYSS